MSIVEVDGLSVADLQTLSQLPTAKNILGIVKLVAGNFPSGFQAEAITVGQLLEIFKSVIQTPVNNLADVAYPTLAEALTHIDDLPSGKSVLITNDGENNGLYLSDGTTLNKTEYDAIVLSDVFSDIQTIMDVVKLDETTDVTSQYGDVFYTLKKALYEVIQTGGFEPFLTQSALLASVPTVPKKAAKALDTHKIWYWNGSSWIDTGLSELELAKLYADANAFFKPIKLEGSYDIGDLPNGYAIIPSDSIASTLTGLPTELTQPRRGYIFTFSGNTTHYQRLVRDMSPSIEVYERTGNGQMRTSPSFAWNNWVRAVSRTEITSLTTGINSLTTEIANVRKSAVNINLFPNPLLTSSNAFPYQATHSVENGFNTVSLNSGGVTAVFYDLNIVSDKNFNVGDEIVFSAEIDADGFGATNGGDISLEFYDASNIKIGSTITVYNTNVGVEKLSISTTIPANTARIRFRLVRRGGANTYTKFRKVALTSNNWNVRFSQNTASQSATNQQYFVAKTGSDSNVGSSTSPFLTIQKAVNSLGANTGIVTILDDGWYREVVTVNSTAHVTIQSARDKRAKIVGSTQLALTKTSGRTRVYQASLATKPTGMGGNRGQAMIAEWGTASSLIAEADIHHVQRGETYRLPYSEMFEVTSIADVDSQNGTWYWEAGIIYLSATDGSDATAKQYEARSRQAIVHSVGSIKLSRLDILFADSSGFISTGTSVYREDCRAYGCKINGFSDNANSTVSYRDIALNNGNDGFNGTVTSYATENLTTATQANYYDSWSALNGDDGISFHIRGTCNIYGGLYEYNTKAGVVHVTGGGGNCYNTVARGQDFGFYAATTPPDGRNLSILHCHNTIAERNDVDYCAGSNGSKLQAVNAISIDPISWGYAGIGGQLTSRNCKFSGDPSKMKSGNVVVENFDAVT